MISSCVLGLVQGCSKDQSAERAVVKEDIRKTEHLIREMDRTYSNEIAFIKGVSGSDKPDEMNAKLRESAETHDANVQRLQEQLKHDQAELERLGGK